MAPTDDLTTFPLRMFYEAAKVALVKLEAIPANTPLVDWPYIEDWKQRMRADIRELESRFSDRQTAKPAGRAQSAIEGDGAIDDSFVDGVDEVLEHLIPHPMQMAYVYNIRDDQKKIVVRELARSLLTELLGFEVESIRCGREDLDGLVQHWTCQATRAGAERPCLVDVAIDEDTYSAIAIEY